MENKLEEIKKIVTCLHCGQTKDAIRKHKLFCATETNTEAGRETDQEWDRHRFTPYSKKELDAIVKDELEMLKEMGDFAEFVKKEEKKLSTLS